MRARALWLVGALLLLSIGVIWWLLGGAAKLPPGPVTEPPQPTVEQPVQSAPPNAHEPEKRTPRPVCPGGGDAAVAVSAPADAHCPALAVIQSPNPWDPLDPTPSMPTYGQPEPAVRNRYRLALQVDPDAGRVEGEMALHFTNGEDEPLGALFFHLYPNARYFTENWDGRVSRPGALIIQSVTLGGRAVAYSGGSAELLEVRLPAPLEPGASLDLALTYQLTVPTMENDRLGTDGRTLFLGNAYPILAVYDAGGWHLDRYLASGDPFYSEVADYAVSVQVPQGYDVAATGRPERGANGEFTFTAARVRDFGMAVSSAWSRHERAVEGLRIHYLRDETLSKGAPTPKQVLDQIEGAVRHFSDWFGPYPYADLTVVDRVGMEYPQFVMGGPELHTVIHEVAHQWWYGVVGNDQLRQIWDEGLTEFSTLLYEATVRLPGPTSLLGDKGGWPMDDSLYRYAAAQGQGQISYGQVIYRRGWRFWEALRQQLGDERFFAMAQAFYQRHQYGTATWADWRQAVMATGDQVAEALFDEWVYGAPVPAGAPHAVAPIRR